MKQSKSRVRVIPEANALEFAGHWGLNFSISIMDPFQGRGEPCWAVPVLDVLTEAGYCCGPDDPCAACEDRAFT